MQFRGGLIFHRLIAHLANISDYFDAEIGEVPVGSNFVD